MSKLIKIFSKEDLRRVTLIFGVGSIPLLILLIIASQLINIQILVFICLFAIFPTAVSLWFDGLNNEFSLKRVLVFKVVIGSILVGYSFISIFSYFLFNDLSLYIFLIIIETLIIGISKFIIGAMNLEYVSWYRNWLMFAGAIIIVVSILFIMLPLFAMNYFFILVIITNSFMVISNLLYVCKKIEIINDE